MAKGDDKTNAQNQMTTQSHTMQAGQNALMNNLYGTNTGMQNNYNAAGAQNFGDYNNIMSGYQNVLNNPGGTGGSGGGGGVGDYGDIYGRYSQLAGGNQFAFDPMFRGAIGKAIGGYGDFADTGGFTPQGIQDIRARAIAPTRAIYSNAQDDLNRNRSLQGYSPNYNAASARMAREQSQIIGDQNTNANAGIAQMIQQGRLAGLGGLVNAGGTGQGLQNDINSLNGQMQLAGLSGMLNTTGASSASSQAASDADNRMRLAALSGMQSLYGTTPGMSELFGNQVLNSGNQLIAGQGLQNQSSLGQMGMQAGILGKPGIDWAKWGQIAGGVGTAAIMASSRKLKENIEEVDSKAVTKKLDGLKLYKWNYKTDPANSHIGPMAEEFQKAFGVGDGKTIHAVDAIGVMLAKAKELR